MRDYEAMSKRHFDSQAKDYDSRDTMYYSKFPKISCRDVAEKLKSHHYEKLLDIGCGTGYLIELLKKQKEAQYFGLDLSGEMIKIARSKFDESVQFVEGTADKLPYPDNTFDVVCCIQSFHHYPYPEEAVAQACRVLKKDGIYILSDTGCSGIAKVFDNFLFRHFAKSGDYAAYSRKDIEKLMKNNGFDVVSSKKVQGLIYTVTGKKK